jgi:hypothetical protein
MPAKRRPARPKGPAPNASPEERTRAAVAKEEAVPGDRVCLTFRLVLARHCRRSRSDAMPSGESGTGPAP